MDSGEREIRRALVKCFGWQASEALATRIYKAKGKQGNGWYVQPPDMETSFYLGKTVKAVLGDMKAFAVGAGGERG